MKKNININLFGSLYAIDEDAYELLKKYEDNIRAYFSKQEGGDEIADDIERRVAELFEEYKSKGVQAISIEHVQDIIGRIGNPEQMEEGDTSAEAADSEAQSQDDTAKPHGGKRKLFRDPNDKMLGGVMSGLAHYFGCDALPLRLLMLFLCIFTSGSFLLVYIIFWVIVPQARTAEDFLRMNGQMVTPEGIGQTVMNDSNDAYAGKPERRRGLDYLLAALMLCLKVVLYFFAGVIFLTLVGCLIAAIIVAFVGLSGEISTNSPLMHFLDTDDSLFLLQQLNGAGRYFWWLIVSCIVLCAIPIYVIVHHVMRLRRSAEPMSIAQRVAWLVVWIASLAMVIVSGTIISDKVDKAEELQEAQEAGRTLAQWNILQKKCIAPTDSADIRLWSRKNNEDTNGESAFKDEIIIPDVEPGIYRISTQAFADDDGAYIYAKTDNGKFKESIAKGDPEELLHSKVQVTVGSKNAQGKIVQVKVNQPSEVVLPSVTISKVRVERYGDLRIGVEVRTDDYYDCKYLLYNRNFTLERVGDVPGIEYTQPVDTAAVEY